MKTIQKSEQLINEQKEQAPIRAKQVAKLGEIGAQLRQTRLKQSITIEEAAVHTMIRAQMLREIEAGKLERLPEPIYIQGLLLRYAKFLGFDGSAIAQDFPVSQKRFVLKTFWLDLFSYLPRLKFRPLHLYVVYLVGIILSVQTLSSQLDSSTSQIADQDPTKTALLAAKNQSESAVPATTAVKSPVTAATQQSSPKPIPPAPANQRVNPGVNQGVKVGLTLKDASWIVISADGKIEFEGMLPSGTQRTWEASEKLVVVAGNAGGVLLAVNNGQAEQMGAQGQVIEREVLISRP
jgi:cytoskeletal protein RodZ